MGSHGMIFGFLEGDERMHIYVKKRAHLRGPDDLISDIFQFPLELAECAKFVATCRNA